MLKARASVFDLAREVPDLIDLQHQDHSVPVICIELVASRFLRRMVRKIVVRIHTYIHTAYDKLVKTGYKYFYWIQGTAIRECSVQLTPVDERNVSVLLDICLQGDRY